MAVGAIPAEAGIRIYQIYSWILAYAGKHNDKEFYLDENEMQDGFIVNRDDPILITGSNGFIGSRVVETLIGYGFQKVRCFVRPSSNLTRLKTVLSSCGNFKSEVIQGNLLSREDCCKATDGVSVIIPPGGGDGENISRDLS